MAIFWLWLVLAISQGAEIPKHSDLSNFRDLSNVRLRIPVLSQSHGNLRVTFPDIYLQDFISDKIIGGSEAIPNEYPWQAAIFMDSIYFCGGSLLSPDVVLTAGHCCFGYTEFRILLGAHNVRLSSEPNRIEMVTTNRILHQGYDADLLLNDICIVRLPENVTYTAAIQPITLEDDYSNSYEGQTVVVSGWGKNTDDSFGISSVLHKTNATVISNADCQSAYPGFISDGNLCISSSDGRGVCHGDSGGPLSYVSNRFTEIGIASFVSDQGCESGLPHGFTRVGYFREWIRQNGRV